MPCMMHGVGGAVCGQWLTNVTAWMWVNKRFGPRWPARNLVEDAFLNMFDKWSAFARVDAFATKHVGASTFPVGIVAPRTWGSRGSGGELRDSGPLGPGGRAGELRGAAAGGRAGAVLLVRLLQHRRACDPGDASGLVGHGLQGRGPRDRPHRDGAAFGFCVWQV